jgi:GPH family glycoside/pentoside/hexuronide:cation symporter
MSRAPFARYALLGLPLGFVGLPLYMHLPHYYVDGYGVSLATIGLLLFVTRFADCFADPFIGSWLDRHPAWRKRSMLLAAIAIIAGMAGLFSFPALSGQAPSTAVIAALLLVTYLSYSLLSINYYAFGVPLASSPAATARLSGFREAAIALGVLLAGLVPLMGSAPGAYAYYAVLFALLLVVGLLASWRLFLPVAVPDAGVKPLALLRGDKALGWVYGIFFFNAAAPAITATLFLFYVETVLQLPESSGLFLGVYFLCAIMAMPVWAWLSKHVGKHRSLLCSMALALACFGWAYALGAGDKTAFLIICILTGIAYGGDMAILPSLLADRLQAMPQASATAFGLWNFISKLVLALAAGIALPALEWLGYAPQTQGSAPAVAFAYALLPCFFKAVALVLLFISPFRHERVSL